MTEVDLNSLLDELDDNVATELSSKPEVIDKGHALDLGALPIVARKWHKLRDGVAVVADLKSSTQLGLNKHAASTASIYEASTGGVVKIFDEFGADFVAIQGDGAFALFWGGGRLARALCAGISIKTFSYRYLTPQLEKKWDTLPETGLKVGIASSSPLVKRVGVPRSPHQEPVWAGKAVNYAAKAAQQADRHDLIVAGAIWDWVSQSDYLALSCPCGSGPGADIWQNVTIEKIPESDSEREGKFLKSFWCETHGAEYCEAILAGKTRRLDVKDQRMAALQQEMRNMIRSKAAQDRRDRLARLEGLSMR
jgi:class 3 adenylate cyclase